MVNMKILFFLLRVCLVWLIGAKVLEVTATCIVTFKMDQLHELTNARVFPEKLTVTRLLNSPHFSEPEGLLPHSEARATCS
jgi:hypothetical protein